MIVVEKNTETQMYAFTAVVDSLYIERIDGQNLCVRTLDLGVTHYSPYPLFVSETREEGSVNTLVIEVMQYYDNQ